MKTKIKILIVSCVMAAAAVTGFNMAQNSNIMDLSLADIAVMAKADDGEAGGGGDDCTQCVVKHLGVTVFSCKPKPGVNCSKTHKGTTVSCTGAEEC